MRSSEWVELIFYVGAAGAFVVATVSAAYRALRLKPAHKVLARLGAHWETREHGQLHTLRGHEVVLRAAYDKNGQLTSLRMHWPRQIGTGLSLSQRSRLHPAGFDSGDARFDEEVYAVANDDLLAWSVLADDARAAIRKAVAVGGQFEDFHWSLDGSAVEPDQLEEAIQRIDKAAGFTAPAESVEEVRERVMARAQLDPDPDVRLHALDVLVRRQLTDDRLLATCETSLQPAMRLLAAKARGERGRGGLKKLLARGSVSYRVQAAQALVALGITDELADIEDTLVAALADDRFADPAGHLLADIGTMRVLPALGAITDGPGAGPAALARAAIQSRVDPSLAGAVSLADSGSGQLAVAAEPPQAGGLSEAT